MNCFLYLFLIIIENNAFAKPVPVYHTLKTLLIISSNDTIFSTEIVIEATTGWTGGDFQNSLESIRYCRAKLKK